MRASYCFEAALSKLQGIRYGMPPDHISWDYGAEKQHSVIQAFAATGRQRPMKRRASQGLVLNHRQFAAVVWFPLSENRGGLCTFRFGARTFQSSADLRLRSSSLLGSAASSLVLPLSEEDDSGLAVLSTVPGIAAAYLSAQATPIMAHMASYLWVPHQTLNPKPQTLNPKP